MATRNNIILVRAIIIFLACGSVVYARRRNLKQQKSTACIKLINKTPYVFTVSGLTRGNDTMKVDGSRLEPHKSLVVYTDKGRECRPDRTRWELSLKPDLPIRFFTINSCLDRDRVFAISCDSDYNISVMREN